MKMKGLKHALCFVYVGIAMVSAASVELNVTKQDEMIWKARAENAKQHAMAAFDPHPHDVTNQLNSHVHK